MFTLEQRTIEILAQVVFKEMYSNSDEYNEDFWKQHKETTLELARNILRVSNELNHTNEK